MDALNLSIDTEKQQKKVMQVSLNESVVDQNFAWCDASEELESKSDEVILENDSGEYKAMR